MRVQNILKSLIVIICVTVFLNSCSKEDDFKKSAEFEVQYRFIMESYQDKIVSIQFRNEQGGLDEGFNYDPDLLSTGIWTKTININKPFEPYLKVTFDSPAYWNALPPFSLQIYVNGELQISKSTRNSMIDSMVTIPLE